MKKVKEFFRKIGGWLKNHAPSKRRLIQLYTALLYNANLKGYIDGQLFNGATKKMCLPGFNCYSCPGAIGACPLGSLQGALTNSDHKWTAYVFGILAIFGIMLGRTICGFLCPLGLCQDLLYKIPSPKVKKSWLTRIFSYFKYVVLGMMVVVLPLMYMEGSPVPSFCKYICPAGLFEGAFGLLPNNPSYYGMLGVVFSWKFLLLVAFIVLSIVFFRFFCRFICPLGALYGFFCKVALLGVKVDKKKCTDCGMCIAVCKMDVKTVGDHECINCGECIRVCPTKAISWKGAGLFVRTNDLDAPTPEGKPLTALLEKNGAITQEVAAETVAVATETPKTVAEEQKEPTMAGLKMVDSQPEPISEKIKARAKERKRNKILEIVAWCLAGVMLVGALLYANVFVKSKPKTEPPAGMVSKNFTLQVYGGESYTLYDHAKAGEIGIGGGKATVVLFWQADKKECEDLMPVYGEVANRFGNSVNVLAVHSQETYGKDIGKWVQKWENTSITFAQDSMQESLGSNLYDYLVGGTAVYPTLAVLDSEGRLRHVTNNGFGTADALYERIAENLTGYGDYAVVGKLFTSDVKLKALNKDTETYYDLGALNKPIIINFWFTTCSPCVEEMPEINAFYEECAGAIDTVAVHQHIQGLYTEQTVKDFLYGNPGKKIEPQKDVHGKLWKDYTIAFAKDQEFADGNTLHYALCGKGNTWPATIVLNQDGFIIYRKDGKMVAEDFAELKIALDAWVA